MSNSRKQYQPQEKLLTDPVMAHMREVAFGSIGKKLTRTVINHAERMRDDNDLLIKAEEKDCVKQIKG